MSIGSYPRVTVQGTGNANNIQNGLGLMLFNSTTGKYEAATSSTFGGGGGGDATAANQATQISEAQNTNSFLQNIENEIGTTNSYLFETTSGFSAAQLLGFIANLIVTSNTKLQNIENELISLNTATIDGSQLTQIIGDGNIAYVDSSNQLKVKTSSV
jgi:hypothetical protein